MEKKIDLRTLIIKMLCHSPEKIIKGKTRLEKMTFLILDRLLKEGLIDEPPVRFVKYFYGPFNKEILEVAEKLEKEGVIEIYPIEIILPGGKKDVFETHYILKKKEICSKIPKLDPRIERIIKEIVEKYSEMPLTYIIRKVYVTKPDERLLIEGKSL